MSTAPDGVRVEVHRRLGAFRLSVDFTADARGVTALFGPSGAGKSATLAAIGGALQPESGRITIGNETLFDSGTGVNLRPEKRGVGWVSQDARLFPHLSVEGNLRFGERRARGRPHRIRFDDVVGVLGIAPLLARRPRDLSGGERQRVAIGRALLSRPRLLMLDEPLAALDHARKAEILPYLERLGDGFGLPILYVTHALGEVMRLANRLVVLDAGTVVAQGFLAEVLARGDPPQLARRADIGVTLETKVADGPSPSGLTRLEGEGFDLLVGTVAQSPGARVRVAVLARDVLLATQRPVGLSARNLLPGRLEALLPREDGTVLARVQIGPSQTLLSAVTQDAVQALGLAPGDSVWAVIKSVAVEGSRGGGLLDLLDE